MMQCLEANNLHVHRKGKAKVFIRDTFVTGGCCFSSHYFKSFRVCFYKHFCKNKLEHVVIAPSLFSNNLSLSYIIAVQRKTYTSHISYLFPSFPNQRCLGNSSLSEIPVLSYNNVPFYPFALEIRSLLLVKVDNKFHQ